MMLSRLWLKFLHILTLLFAGDILESLLGAVYIDSDFDLDEVWAVYERVFPYKDEVIRMKPQSPVKTLFEMFPERVTFRKSSKTPARSNKTITVVEIASANGKSVMFRGQGNNGKAAKDAAARCAIREVKKRNLVV